MHAGHILSGLGHGGFLLMITLAGAFDNPQERLDVAQVSMISVAAFDAIAAQKPPQAPLQALSAERFTSPAEQKTPLNRPQIRGKPKQVPTSAAPVAERQDPTPQKPMPIKPVKAELSQDTPDLASPSLQEDLALLTPEVKPVQAPPKQAARIAPMPSEATAPPPPRFDNLRPHTRPRDITPGRRPAPRPQEAKPDRTQKEEAAPRIVTEADKQGDAIDFTRLRPMLRPKTLTPPPVQDPAVAERATAPRNADTEPNYSDAISSLLSGLQEDVSETTQNDGSAETAHDDVSRMANVGAAVQTILAEAAQCWYVDPFSEAAQVTVVLGLNMSREGRIVPGTISLVESSTNDEAASAMAFRAAQRALLQCQDQTGRYPLPVEYFEDWRALEIVFNPDLMRNL